MLCIYLAQQKKINSYSLILYLGSALQNLIFMEGQRWACNRYFWEVLVNACIMCIMEALHFKKEVSVTMLFSLLVGEYLNWPFCK